MQKLQLFFALIVGSLLLAGCSSTGRTFIDQDPAQDFSSYQTFGWIEPKPMTAVGDHIVSPLSESRIMKAVQSNLESKGYRLVQDVSTADFAVSFTVGARDKIQTRTEPGRTVMFDPWLYRSNWRWGNRYYDFYYPEPVTTLHSYTEGTLAIDLFDVARKSPVWHGAGTKRLTRKDLQSPTDGIDGAVDTLLASFPTRN